ncbi:MAG: sigma-70 family RNA polymerase sigma factor [Planctomycetes bacterium]|nr:sigma-70 family RNA polymerase sigma factor [Planctomycetota bacterium]
MEATGGDTPRRGLDPRFEALFGEVAPALYAWAELRIRPGLRARLDPQDLVQEVWIRGMQGFARFDERGVSFRAWAFRIGKNILMESLRATRNEIVGTPGGVTSRMLALERVPQDVTSFTQRLAREESVRSFLDEAGSLAEVDRMLLLHCGLEGETCARAATKLGISEDAAIKRWQRLKARLRGESWSRAILGPEE